MWLMTPFGFFSIVCKPDDAEQGTLTIRARVRSDLEALRRDYLPSLGSIVDGGGTDYQYRARAPREAVAAAVGEVARQIAYGNFKNEVLARQGKHRSHSYGQVWSALYDLGEPRERRARH
jgi:hypothetical protein